VRTLVDTGFLLALEPRRGARGSREIGYRATEKSWYVDAGDARAEAATARAAIDAFVAESDAAGLAGVTLARLALRLTDAELTDLQNRLYAVLQEYAGRPPTPGGRPWSLFLAVHPDPSRD